MTITSITSQSQLDTLLSSNAYVVADFYADWCGPCKMIAPIFQQLAQEHHKPGRIQFVKIDVDGNRDVSGKYGVSAMPTFLVFKNSSVAQTIRGADPGGLRSAVSRAASDAAKGPAKASTAFQSKGYTLGSDSQPSRTAGGPGFQMPSVNLGSGFGTDLVRFLGLYFYSLLSLDAYRAAEQSPFAIARR